MATPTKLFMVMSLFDMLCKMWNVSHNQKLLRLKKSLYPWSPGIIPYWHILAKGGQEWRYKQDTIILIIFFCWFPFFLLPMCEVPLQGPRTFAWTWPYQHTAVWCYDCPYWTVFFQNKTLQQYNKLVELICIVTKSSEGISKSWNKPG